MPTCNCSSISTMLSSPTGILGSTVDALRAWHSTTRTMAQIAQRLSLRAMTTKAKGCSFRVGNEPKVIKHPSYVYPNVRAGVAHRFAHLLARRRLRRLAPVFVLFDWKSANLKSFWSIKLIATKSQSYATYDTSYAMGRELQKKKNRSSVAKVRQKPKSKKKILNNPIIAANW